MTDETKFETENPPVLGLLGLADHFAEQQEEKPVDTTDDQPTESEGEP